MGGWVGGMHVPSLSFHVLRRKLSPCWYLTISLALFSVAVAVSTHL